MSAVQDPAVDGPPPASLVGFLRSLWPGHPPYAAAVVSSQQGPGVTVVVERSTVVEVDCAAGCPRGIAHDLQALLVLASVGAVPRPSTVRAVQWPEPGPPPPGMAVRIAVRLLQAVSDRRPVRVPMAWLGPGSDLELGPGPGRGRDLRLGAEEWDVLRQLVSGGFPAVSASGDWEIASRLLADGAVRLEGTEECGVFSRPGLVAVGVPARTRGGDGSIVAAAPHVVPAPPDVTPSGVAPLPRRSPADPAPARAVDGRRRALQETRRAAEEAARSRPGVPDVEARQPLDAAHRVGAAVDQVAPTTPVSMSTLRRLVEALRAM